jgi:hypothetical protein
MVSKPDAVHNQINGDMAKRKQADVVIWGGEFFTYPLQKNPISS